MASLKFIMDVDEEQEPQTNKRDDGAATSAPSQGHDSSRSAVTSFAIPQEQSDTLTPTSSTRRRGPLNRPSKSSTTAPSTSSSTSPTRPSLSRQRSTDSTDSMDHTAYGGQGQGSSSGSMPPSNAVIRPLVNASSSAEANVRLTPITGRVSRAKKGMPVHVCDLCRPSKVSPSAQPCPKRARELIGKTDIYESGTPQLSHKTPGYTCTWPGCDRAFHRPDLLARHAQKHEQEGKGKGTSGAEGALGGSATPGENYPMNMSPVSSPMLEGSNTQPMMNTPPGMQSGSTYASNVPPYSMPNTGSGRGQTPMSPSQNFHPHDRPQADSSGQSHGNNYALSNEISIMHMPGTDFSLDFNQPRTPVELPLYIGSQGLPHGLSSLTIPDNGPDLLAHSDLSPWQSSASDSNFSTPSDASQNRILRSYGSPTSDWTGPGMVPSYQAATSQELRSPSVSLEATSTTLQYMVSPFSSSPQPATSFGHMMDVPIPFQDEHNTMLDQVHHHQPYSSVRSLSPPTILSSVQTAEHLVTASIPLPGTPPMVGRFKGAALLSPLSGAASLIAAVGLSRPVRNVIPEYLELYWKRCDAHFPLVHRRGVNSTGELLRCAMAAMATQFLPGKEDRIKGNQLHEFAWQEVRRVPQWSVQDMQTILLCEFYARFRGRKVVTRPSQQFRSLYSRVAEQQVPPDYVSSAATREERWDRWIEAESLRRLFAGCFILDVHTSVYHEQPLIPQFSTPTPPIPLIQVSDGLWSATTSESWESRKPYKTRPATLDQVTLTPEAVADAPPMDRATFAASELLRLPKRVDAQSLDLSVEVDRSSVERIRKLFPDSPVPNTYLALYYTPLHDLLAVSGDSWLFTQKVLPAENFQQHQKRLKLWSGSQHASTAAGFAARALLYFLDTANETTDVTNTYDDDADEEDGDIYGQRCNDISDYWSLYVCALICWAITHHATRRAATAGGGTGSASPSRNANSPGGGAGRGHSVVGWLRMVGSLGPGEVPDVRDRTEAAGVVGMARRRLEYEAAGSKSRLLVDALGVLKRLEEGINWKRF
ncbi:hypothetical protein DL762_008658 [Monosporascus cannonballus]|uniref:C2H2-type domain-containing protein n=1 Tax=Monosporascus cannonballus TaxID=155416 RepID=A0ABY0GW40_9PEZI|nr:hypothetical protein DL762_008658 [Monosporascus cannonballus]